MTDNNFFYFIDKSYIISDAECCAKSNRTFDIQLAFIANYKQLLNELRLFYLFGGVMNNITEEYRMKWFANYLSSMSTHRKDDKYQKLLGNPTIRLLITDEVLLNKVRTLDIETLSSQYTLTMHSLNSSDC